MARRLLLAALMRRPALSSVAVIALLTAPHAFGCSGDQDDLDDIADDTTLHVRRTAERGGGDSFVLTLEVDGVKKGSLTSAPDCPEIAATFAVDGADSATASRQGGVAHSTSEGCRDSTVDNYSCRPLRFETSRGADAFPSIRLELTDDDAHWSVRVDDVPSSTPTVTLADAQSAAPGGELRLRVWPPPGHPERLSITVYSEQGSGELELAGSARWVAPDVVALTLPATLVPDGDHPGKVGVALSLPGAYEPRVTQCDGPRACVLEGDGFIRDVITHMV